MSRIRNTEYRTVHHLTSRIAHGVFFLEDSERNDFLSITKRVSAFTGVELIGWCIMHNHFHLYVYLPEPPALSDEEVLQRYHLLKGDAPRVLVEETGAEGLGSRATPSAIPSLRSALASSAATTLRANFEDGRMAARDEIVRAIRRRMYSIAEYMRMIKQWFSEDYNARTGHKGTMWQATYGDHPFFLPEETSGYDDLRDILAYIHLNPIRATITDKFDGYAWSSYTAYRKGEPDAVRAMHLAYRGFDDDAEIVSVHEERMTRLLEDWKRKRAEEIVRKRAEGLTTSTDPLLDACMVEQAANHAMEIQKELERLHAERDLLVGAKARRAAICSEITCVLKLHPEFSAHDIASVIKVPVRSVQRYLAQLRPHFAKQQAA